MSPPDPEATNVTVEYRDGEPQHVEVETTRYESEFQYQQTYRFRVESKTAVLVWLKSDANSGRYPVRANEGTREAAARAVLELPFIERVTMFMNEYQKPTLSGRGDPEAER